MDRFFLPLFVMLAAASAGAQDIVWAEGGGPLSRDVFRVPESNPTATPQSVLTGCELLPIEITCRTAQQALRDDVARRVVRRGLARVELPDGGSLFRYRRALGTRFGFLWLAADGTPQVLAERNGGGAAGTDDPFADRIGIAPDGRAAVVVTAAGNALILRLDGATFASTGSAVRSVQVQHEFDPLAVAVGRNVAWLMSADDRVWICGLGDLAQPVEITPAAASGARTKPFFAPAADGRSAAFLYGVRPDFGIYVAGEQGPALQIPVPAAHYEEPGYLPEVALGPKLLLDDDGSQLLYVDATSRDEIFVADVAGVRATTQWTGDNNFQPYIGVIVLPFALNHTFVAGIGDPGLFDVYAAASGVPLTQNLTSTAGNLTRPYGVGGLLPSAFCALHDGSLLSSFGPSSGGPDQVWQFGTTGPSPRGFALDAPLERGAASGSGTPKDLRLPSASGDVLLDGSDGHPLVVAPAGVRLSTSVLGPGGAYRVFLADALGHRALFVHLPGAGIFGVPADGFDDAVLTAGGSLLLAGPDSLLVVGPSGTATLSSGTLDRITLSGQGTGGL